MRILFTKKEPRSQIMCIREDGTFTSSTVSAGLPHHDLAHYVIERALKLNRGFYGNIAAGYSMQDLGDKEIIKTLPPETMQAETVAGALQFLERGSSDIEQFFWMVQEGLGEVPAGLTPTIVQAMLSEFQALLQKWEALPEGETMELLFS